MTDKEITMGLKCLCGDEIPCKNCAYKTDVFVCRKIVAIDALELINCQKTEIKRLRELLEMTDKAMKIANENSDFMCNQYERAKSEAVKEFANRLKDKSLTKWDYHNAVDIEEIDNIVKEMVGDTE